MPDHPSISDFNCSISIYLLLIMEIPYHMNHKDLQLSEAYSNIWLWRQYLPKSNNRHQERLRVIKLVLQRVQWYEISKTCLIVFKIVMSKNVDLMKSICTCMCSEGVNRFDIKCCWFLGRNRLKINLILSKVRRFWGDIINLHP